MNGHVLQSGADYKQALRDGREVWSGGERVSDVTDDPVLGPGIDFQARIYDEQSAEARPNRVLTYELDGEVVPTSWLIPRSEDQLDARLRDAEYRCWKSFGSFHGRQPNHLPTVLIGQLAYIEKFRELSPQYADNLASIYDDAKRRNLHVIGSVIEPQGTRARSAKAGEDRSAVARVTRRDANGVYLSGAKAVGTGAVQAHELLIGSIYYPHLRKGEAFWCMVPMDTPGIRLLCREAVAPSPTQIDLHPVASIGEEMDTLVLLEDVFVPYERIWALDAPKLCDPAFFGTSSRLEFWTHLIRQTVRAEFLAGLAQAVTDALELGAIQPVQDHVAELTQYAQILRSGLRAATDSAAPTREGILLPDGATVNAFRVYGLEHYGRMKQLLQTLSSQGLVTRVSYKDFDHFRDDLESYMATAAISAAEKNRLMSLVWDMTSGAYAGRTEVFELVNGTPPSIMRHLLYFIGMAGRIEAATQVKQMLGLGLTAEPVGASATQAWISGRSRGEGTVEGRP